jgi:glycosyltransferase involved in cell wall biosynthesis
MDNTKKPKILVISQNFPPELTASSVLVNNIFSYYTGDFEAIAGFVFGRYSEDFKAPCKTTYLTPPDNYFLKRGYYKLTPKFRFVNKFLIRRLVKKIKPDIIFGNYPEIEFFISSFEIAKELNIPFYAYFHDLWEENMHNANLRRIANYWERKIILGSSRVICCTEYQQSYFKKKYGVSTSLLLHPIPDSDIENYKIEEIKEAGEKNLVFIGTLSKAMNQDALITISKSLKYLPDNYKLVWYPIQDIPLDLLKSEGFDTDKIIVKVVSTDEMKRAVKSADLLLAPLSFKNCSEEEVKTVFSNKLLTYLVSGRPILVFSPEDCYHSVSANENGWAYVVDKNGEQNLANEILTFINNSVLKQKTIDAAREETEKRKSSVIAGELLKMVLEDTKEK